MFGLSFIVLKAFAWVPSFPPAGAAQSEGAGKTAGTAGKALGVKEVESLGPAPSESKELLEAGFSKLSLFKIFWLKASKALACFSIMSKRWVVTILFVGSFPVEGSAGNC